MKSSTWNALAAAALFSMAGWLSVSNAAEPPEKDKPAAQAEAPKQDVVIFRNGTVLYGKVVSETATSIHFKGKIAGIDAETDYPKADILDIKRAGKTNEPAPVTGSGAAPVADIKTPAKTAEPVDDGMTKKNVYWMDLEGKFGEEISQTPIKKLIQDAKANRADVIIVKINSIRADPRSEGGDSVKELPDDIGEFDELWRAEKMLPLFVDEMPVEWDGKDGRPPMPRIVFWVKRAMGGACFLPLFCKEIYFDPDGKMGGIGNLSYMLKGHERVVNKQISLRLQHAVGWALVGGYPEELVRAMAQIEYVLSVRYENGKPIFIEGLPTNPGEELLKTDGTGTDADSIEMLARDEGKNVLTLTAPVAKKLLVSKGTVSTKEELLSALGLERSGKLTTGKSERITKDWNDGLENAKVQIKGILDDLRAVKVEPPGGYDQRTKARGLQLRKYDELKQVLTKWGEGMDPYWLSRHGIRMNQHGEPDISAIDTVRERIKIEQLKDHK
jgi:hypothetical protein